MTPYYSQAYLNTQVETSDRVDLVIAMYEGAVANVNQAIDAVDNEDDDRRMVTIEKASKIIMALSDSLDFSQEGGIPGQLYALYGYMLRQLLHANRDKDSEGLEVVRGSLAILLDGWLQVSQSQEAGDIRKADALQRAKDGRNATAQANRPAVALTA